MENTKTAYSSYIVLLRRGLNRTMLNMFAGRTSFSKWNKILLIFHVRCHEVLQKNQQKGRSFGDAKKDFSTASFSLYETPLGGYLIYRLSVSLFRNPGKFDILASPGLGKFQKELGKRIDKNRLYTNSFHSRRLQQEQI